jgi:uncharacterized damage-inducible protein DinB
MTETKRPEPWLRGTLHDVPAVRRAVLHALQLAEEDLTSWCGELDALELNSRPGGLASVAFQIRHISRSVDRLLSYAEGRQLDEMQIAALKAEMDDHAVPHEVFAELNDTFERATRRVRELASEDLEAVREVGRKKLPATLGGLLVHVADHTQRHVGQAITTAKIVRASKKGAAK